MNFKKRSLIFMTFFGSCLAISLLAASLGTRVWVTADCKRTTNASAKSNGTVNFGLFEYEANLNWGLGDRPTRKQMLGPEGVMYHERQFMVYELYIATIATVVAAIFFGIISAMLAIVNTASNPIEAICHVPGLYLWNGLALFSGLAAVVTWLVQFYLRLRDNVLVREFREAPGSWSSAGRAGLGSSFWLAVLACVVFIIDITIIATATRDRHSTRKGKALQPVQGKQAGDTMLY